MNLFADSPGTEGSDSGSSRSIYELQNFPQKSQVDKSFNKEKRGNNKKNSQENIIINNERIKLENIDFQKALTMAYQKKTVGHKLFKTAAKNNINEIITSMNVETEIQGADRSRRETANDPSKDKTMKADQAPDENDTLNGNDEGTKKSDDTVEPSIGVQTIFANDLDDEKEVVEVDTNDAGDEIRGYLIEPPGRGSLWRQENTYKPTI